ncbi:hypothetical protein NDU88_007097 [Pleurodeles waltl]|uniref:Uncharacterized protein n=1 Tax=Pleurodeles waltl TaxID=8319 RepID=A0AAV7RS63_PLEWA|nr:hypothetical protein NDU88_007097 [Pleurodeles waltl]
MEEGATQQPGAMPDPERVRWWPHHLLAEAGTLYWRNAQKVQKAQGPNRPGRASTVDLDHLEPTERAR